MIVRTGWASASGELGQYISPCEVTEMAAQLQAREAELDFQWIPRNQNEEADGLTNEDFSQFDPSRRIMVESCQR